EVDQNGIVYGPATTDLTRFDPANPPLCVPLGRYNSPAIEHWQLINVATENHNFHIHQTKFRVVSKDELAGTVTPKGILLDNVPLPVASGSCGSDPVVGTGNAIADWRLGLCQATPVTVEIPFAIAGDFVYHCHILEHEDGGMMARIHVQPSQ
ncbi:MAG: copper oxidase, partial [Bryobacterales bacterium]|nr:copper oxidase [Bryobacterales bacterium]